jgi:hypothetical protein
MKNKTITAVEWLIDRITNKQNGVFDGFPVLSTDEIYEQAKAMEKRQIIEARVTAPLLSTFDKVDYKEEAEQYYAETYEK